MTTAWVLAYILRFTNEPGEWARVCRVAYATEKQAYAARESTDSPMLYNVCKIEIKDQE